jgi:hypothetical protein
VVLTIPARLRRTGMEKHMVIEGSRSGMPDATLIRLIAKAFRLRELAETESAELTSYVGRYRPFNTLIQRIFQTSLSSLVLAHPP